MALAVAEARRILRPGGVLLDIHPDGQPMRLEFWPAGEAPAAERRRLGELRTDATLNDFIAASAALAEAAGRGWRLAAATTFDYPYRFDSLDELTEYLEDNDELDLAGDDLLERALSALQQATRPMQLVLLQPVVVTALRKT